MFDGTGIDMEVGLIMALGGFAWIAAVMARGAIGSLTERMGKRKK